MGFDPDDFPNSQRYYREALSIPLFYSLTDEQQKGIIRIIKELVG
jgi:dTDP-4-amino-4,6-dideoxygalactose transaminase